MVSINEIVCIKKNGFLKRKEVKEKLLDYENHYINEIACKKTRKC